MQRFMFKYNVDTKTDTVVCYAQPVYPVDTPAGQISPGNMARMFKGVARLKDGDEFNVCIGRNVAQAKAVRQYHKFLVNVYKAMLNDFQRGMDEAERLLAKETDSVKYFTNEIKKH